MNYPEVKEIKCNTEYVIMGEFHNSVKIAPNLIGDNDNSISEIRNYGIDTISRGHLNESITNPSRQMVFNQSFNQVVKMCKDLDFQDEQIVLTAMNIVQSCLIRNISDIKISKTGNHELLLFKKKHNGFANIIIDEDCDVSFMFIGDKLGTEKSKFYPKSKGFNYSEFASLL
jgi:hypothetical protein